MAVCCICRQATPTDGNLSDGTVFHRICYARLIDKVKRARQAEMALFAQLRQPLKFGDQVASLFSGQSRRRIALHRQILTDRIEQLRGEQEQLKIDITQLHDFWLKYPPDWDQRRSLVRARDGYGCAECGVGGQLHLHHRRPLGQGGTNRIDNLVLLCASCHSAAHGGAHFKFNGPQNIDDGAPNAFERKVALINKAISAKRDIHFRYKKPNGATTHRTIAPRELRKLNSAELRALLGPKTKIPLEGRLCVFGHCHLREEKRTFAIDRISSLRLS
jgi:hypothetical protein